MAEEELQTTPPEGGEEKKIEEPKGDPPEGGSPAEGDVEIKPDPKETKARGYGWVPEEEFTGNKDRWVDAKEFMSRAPLFERIDHYRRRVDELEGTVKDIKVHYKKVDETAYKRAIADLKKEKVQALEDENHARVVELDEAMLDLKTEQKEAKDTSTKTAPSGPSEVYQAWVSNNPWYDTNTEMQNAADDIGSGFYNRTGKGEAEVLGHVSRQIRLMFPQAFQNQNRDKPNSVEGSKPAPSQKKKPSWSDLSDEQKQVASKFVKSGIMTREKYVEDLHKIGEI